MLVLIATKLLLYQIGLFYNLSSLKDLGVKFKKNLNLNKCNIVRMDSKLIKYITSLFWNSRNNRLKTNRTKRYNMKIKMIKKKKERIKVMNIKFNNKYKWGIFTNPNRYLHTNNNAEY